MSIHFCRTNKFDLEVLIYHLKGEEDVKSNFLKKKKKKRKEKKLMHLLVKRALLLQI